MSGQQSETKSSFINLRDHYLLTAGGGAMDVRTLRKGGNFPTTGGEGRKVEYCRSFTQGHGLKMSRYFTSESLVLLVCLTVSLLILPLVLPPLPPPPLLLLLLPICILALLMVLAFMPSNVRDATHTYA